MMRCLYGFFISYTLCYSIKPDGEISGDTNKDGGVVSCNHGDAPEMKIRLTKDYIENSSVLNESDFELIGDFYEKTIPEEDLEPSWIDDECKLHCISSLRLWTF